MAYVDFSLAQVKKALMVLEESVTLFCFQSTVDRY